MNIKKIGTTTLCLLLGGLLAACTESNIDKKEDPHSKNKQTAATDIDNTNDSDADKVLHLKNYTDLVNFYNEHGKYVEKLLSKNNIDYYSSNNKSFIASKTKSYKKFEKEYKQSLYAGTNVEFDKGSGSAFIEIDKEFHKDLKPTLDDPYINTIANIFASSVPGSSEAKFIEQLSNAISDTISTGEISQIDYLGGSETITIKTWLKDNTITINTTFSKPFTITPKAPLTKEYSTVAEFDAMEAALINFSAETERASMYENVQLDESNKSTRPKYTINYDRSDSDRFSESIGFDFGSFATEEPFYEDEYTNFTFTDAMKTDFGKFVDVLNKLIEFDINKYMTNEQLMDEIQSRMMANLLKYEDVLGDSLPIPGISFDFIKLSSFDHSDYCYIYAKPEELDIHNNLYDYSIADPYIGKGYYEVGIDINRSVIAEGITSK